jgi:hypothetical protein
MWQTDLIKKGVWIYFHSLSLKHFYWGWTKTLYISASYIKNVRIRFSILTMAMLTEDFRGSLRPIRQLSGQCLKMNHDSLFNYLQFICNYRAIRLYMNDAFEKQLSKLGIKQTKKKTWENEDLRKTKTAEWSGFEICFRAGISPNEWSSQTCVYNWQFYLRKEEYLVKSTNGNL